MSINEGLCSSAIDLWESSKLLFDELSLEFSLFELDVCANHENAKVARFYDKAQDGRNPFTIRLLPARTIPDGSTTIF